MRKIYSTVAGILFLLMAPLLAYAQMDAKWEQVHSSKATYTFYITEGGTWLTSDYLFDQTGGIYVSNDKGGTWNKAETSDYNYNKFYEAEGYVFALGCSGRIARSADDGETWELLNYTRALTGIVDEENWDYTQCYAIAYHNGRLYVGDFSGGGVLYSEDLGETWKNTDVSSMSYEVDDEKSGKGMAVENLYNLASFNGRLYAFGVYFVYRLNEADNTWELLRNDSNFMTQSVIYQGKLCCGRSVMNYTFQTPFIECTEDGNEWGEVPRPDWVNDNNIRTMWADGDDLYVGLQQGGIFYTPDGGENWADISNGLPCTVISADDVVYLSPLALATDEDYVYVAIYDYPFAAHDNSGIFRLAKADLPLSTGISRIGQADSKPRLSADGRLLSFGEDVSGFRIYDLGGRAAPVRVKGNTVCLGTLPQGAYIYSGTCGGKKISGKMHQRR